LPAIDIQSLAEVADLVSKGNLQGVESVAGVFNQASGCDIGKDDRTIYPIVELRHRLSGPLAAM